MDRGRREIPAYAGMTYKDAGHDPKWTQDTGYDVIPGVPAVIPAKAGIWMRDPAAPVSTCAILRRFPRRPGAEERGAYSDEQAASEEKQQQQPARYAGAASSGELVRRNGRRGGRGR